MGRVDGPNMGLLGLIFHSLPKPGPSRLPGLDFFNPGPSRPSTHADYFERIDCKNRAKHRPGSQKKEMDLCSQ